MDKALADLIRISNVTGKDSTLVQGGGGNTSVKTADGKYMYIKASGTALKDMNRKRGWRRMRLDSVLAIIQDESIAHLDSHKREAEVVQRLLAACDDKVTDGARPSVEAHLHALLARCVIHLHPVAVGAYVNAKNGKAVLEKLFAGEGSPSLWLPYTDPGYTLARRIFRKVRSYQRRFGTKPAVIFLQKHGLITSANSAEGALRLVRKVIRICRSKLPSLKARRGKTPVYQDILSARRAIRKAIHQATGRYLPVSYFAPTGPIAAFMARRDAEELLATAALNPDELVYANGSAMWVDRWQAHTIAEKLKLLIKKGRKPPLAFIVKGLGLFVAADEKTAAVVAEITAGSLQIRSWAARFGGLLSLTKREQDFINQWESEAFRKRLAGRLAGGGSQNND